MTAFAQAVSVRFWKHLSVKAYFIRKAADREVVGLFVAPSLITLAGLVDECCDPTLCEYTPAPMGGLMVSDVTAWKWPRPAGQEATGLEEAIFSQQWEEDIDESGSPLDWKSLAPAARRLLRALSRAQETTGPSESPDAAKSTDPASTAGQPDG